MFNGLYKLVSKSDNVAVVKLSDKSHPIFKAHFPMHPILPGFVHFEIVADVFELDITSIKKAKFMALIKPKETLQYEKTGNKFRVLRDLEEVASFTL